MRSSSEIRSWFVDDVYSLLRNHAVALVIADRASLPEAPWLIQPAGGTALSPRPLGAISSYRDSELERWTTRIGGLAQDVYCYFNNDWEGFAINNAALLRRLIDEDDTYAISCC